MLSMFSIALPHPAGSKLLDTLRQPECIVSVSENFRLPTFVAFNDAIAEAADRYQLDPNLIRAIIHAESAFDPLAVSSVGRIFLAGRGICATCSINITEISIWRWPATMRARARWRDIEAFHRIVKPGTT